MAKHVTGPRRECETLSQYMTRGAMGWMIPFATAAGMGYGGAFLSDDTMTMIGILDYSDPVTVAQDGVLSSVGKEFNCRTRTHRCEIDLGGDMTLKFASFAEYQKTADFIAHRMTTSFKGVPIPEDLNRAFIAADLLTPIPYKQWVSTAYAENRFDMTRMNESTKARGAFQVLPDTALEILFDMRRSGKYAHIPEAALVERYKEGQKFKFRVAEGYDQDRLLDNVLNNPMKAVFVAAENKMKYMKGLENIVPDRQLTSLHGYLVHWQGGSGAVKLWESYESAPDAPAYSMYSAGLKAPEVKFNKSMFFDSKGRERSFSQMLDHISKDRGIGNAPMRSFQNWKTPSIQLSTVRGSPEVAQQASAPVLTTWTPG